MPLQAPKNFDVTRERKNTQTSNLARLMYLTVGIRFAAQRFLAKTPFLQHLAASDFAAATNLFGLCFEYIYLRIHGKCMALHFSTEQTKECKILATIDPRK